MATTQVTIGTSPTLICTLASPGQVLIQNQASLTVSVADNPAMTNGEEIAGGTPGGTFSVKVEKTGVPVSFYGTVASGTGTVEVMVLGI